MPEAFAVMLLQARAEANAWKLGTATGGPEKSKTLGGTLVGFFRWTGRLGNITFLGPHPVRHCASRWGPYSLDRKLVLGAVAGRSKGSSLSWLMAAVAEG